MDWRKWRSNQSEIEISVQDGPETHRFDVSYRRTGEGKIPTLFLHGLPTWGYLWRNIHDAVDDAVIPDLAGHGFTTHSSSQVSYSRSVRFQEHFIKAFIDALDFETIRVVGHDWGGAAATRLAVHYPDRIEKMVLSNIVCYDNFPLGTMSTGLALPRDISEDKHLWKELDWDTLEAEMDTIFSGTYDTPSSEFLNGMKAPFLEHPKGDVLRLSKNAASANTNNTLEISGRYGDIGCEVLLLWGADDRAVPPEWAEKLANDIPNSEVAYLNDSYHWVPEDRPEAFRNATKEFLE